MRSCKDLKTIAKNKCESADSSAGLHCQRAALRATCLHAHREDFRAFYCSIIPVCLLWHHKTSQSKREKGKKNRQMDFDEKLLKRACQLVARRTSTFR